MTTLNNVTLKIKIGFELLGCLRPLQKLEMSIINVKSKWDMLKIQKNILHIFVKTYEEIKEAILKQAKIDG